MAVRVFYIRRWLKTLHKTDLVAIDEGGLTLIAMDSGGAETGAYFEIGGTPEDDDERLTEIEGDL